MKEKILIVDDNIDIGRLITEILNKEYDTQLVATGEDALRTVQDFRPDLLILDIMLPDMSGYEVCSQIKSSTEMADLPIIILSAKTGPVARTAGYNLGAINYVEKPFEPSELVAIVKTCLPISSKTKSDSFDCGPLHFDLLKQQVAMSGKILSLTTSEFKVLLRLAHKQNEVVKREDLLDIISTDTKTPPSDRIIDSHISAIRRKVKSPEIQIKSVYAEGYRLLLQ